MRTTGSIVFGMIFFLCGCAHGPAALDERKFEVGPNQMKALWDEQTRTMQTDKNNPIHNWGRVRSLRGSAKLSRDGKAFEKARVGMKVPAGSIVQTEKDSVVDLFIGENGPILRLRSETAITINRLDLEITGVEKVIQTEIELQRGILLGSVKKIAAASKYIVRTPTSVLEIRGTEFSISAQDEVSIVSGAAVVTRDGKHFEIHAGEKFTPAEGVKPDPTWNPGPTTIIYTGEVEAQL